MTRSHFTKKALAVSSEQPAPAFAIPSKTASLGHLQFLLGEPQNALSHAEAMQQLLPLLWARSRRRRFEAARLLTTQVYLPSTLFVLEWNSFPNLFGRALQAGWPVRPAEYDAQREAVKATLLDQLEQWRVARQQSAGAVSNQDLAEDLCEACGQLGIWEAEPYLLAMVDNNQVRMAALIALAALPPARLERLWNGLQNGRAILRERYAAVFSYMTRLDTVPFLLQTLEYQTLTHYNDLTHSLLLALGTIGDPRALPKLNEIAREPDHPFCPTARKAIQRLMREAQGLEEVTLVRASALSTLSRDVLLRPSEGDPHDPRTHELLRPAEPEAQDEKAGEETR